MQLQNQVRKFEVWLLFWLIRSTDEARDQDHPSQHLIDCLNSG